MGVVVRLNKEDTEQYKKQGYIYIDKYIIVYDQVLGAFEYGVNPDDAEYYDHDNDELEYVFLNQDKTEVFEAEEYYYPEDEEDEV